MPMVTESSGRAPTTQRDVTNRWSPGAAVVGGFATVAVCAALAVFETGRLVGSVVVGGTTYPATTLSGPTHVFRQLPALQAWSSAACADVPVRQWLMWWLALDAVFIVGYAVVLLAADTACELGVRRFVWGLVGADAAEDVVSCFVVSPLGQSCPRDPSALATYHRGGLIWVLGFLTAAKWLCLLGILVRSGYLWWLRRRTERHRVSTWKALLHQRFVLIVVLVLTVLLVVPGAPILEQGVDAERSWLLRAHPGSGVPSLLTAVAGTVLLAGLLRYIAGVHVAPPPRAPAPPAPESPKGWRASVAQTWPASRWWLLAAAVIPAVAWFLSWTRIAVVYWRPLGFGLGLLVAVPVLSTALATLPVPRPIAADRALRERSLQVGSFLAWSVPAILAVSVSRAYVAPMLIAPEDKVWSGLAVFGAAAVACGVVFVALKLSAPRVVLVGDQKAHAQTSEAPAATASSAAGEEPEQPAHPGAGRRVREKLTLARKPFRPLAPQRVGARTTDPSRRAVLFSVLFWAAVTIVIGAPLVLWPVHLSNWLGVVGGVMVSLSALAAFYATLVIAAQRIDPPHVFRLLRLRRTPVIGLLLVNGLLVTFWGSDTPLHNIRGHRLASAAGMEGKGLAQQRVTLDQATSAWLDQAQTSGCLVDVTSSGLAPSDESAAAAVTAPSAAPASRVHVRPMIFVAAEGGGIRAAWWTVDAMVTLTRSTCAAGSVFLASGVSGGATGLAMMTAGSSTPYEEVKKLAGPDALAVGTDALLTRDLIAGSFGINARAFDRLTGEAFPDRAALTEQLWAQDSATLSARFLAEPRERPWFTVLNGTSVDHKCRVLVSDIQLGAGTACNDPGSLVPGAYDLFAAQPCYGSIDGSTAQLLAARFPYITPSGRIPDCSKDSGSRTDQIIDGGYTENSGLATINSALTQLMPLVRDRNQQAVAHARADNQPDVTVVVPVVVFLHNSVTVDTGVSAQPKGSPELFIPPLNGLFGGGIIKATSTLLATSGALTATWAPDAATLDPREVDTINHAIDRTMTVAPQEYPQLALPLGWTMSQATRESMDKALGEYLTCSSGNGDQGCGASCHFDQLISALHDPLSFPPDPANPGTAKPCDEG